MSAIYFLYFAAAWADAVLRAKWLALLEPTQARERAKPQSHSAAGGVTYGHHPRQLLREPWLGNAFDAKEAKRKGNLVQGGRGYLKSHTEEKNGGEEIEDEEDGWDGWMVYEVEEGKKEERERNGSSVKNRLEV